MATISSAFRMQDNASRVFTKIANSMGDVIDKADQINSKASNLGAGISSINPSLSQAISKYQELINKQDQINQKIDMMSQQEKLLVADLNREKGAYFQNEKAIFNIERRLMNVRAQKDKLIQQSDQLTNNIYEQAGAVNEVARNSGKFKLNQDNINSGFSKWQAKIVTFNQGLQLARTIGRGIQSALNFSDSITLNTARLGMINDGLQTTEELQNKIFAAAQRSRGSYDDMAKSVAKLGMVAGDSFKNNDEMIAFSEMMNKSFKVSGASQQEISAASYQLTQAMAAGKLQGDEFRSITENAPMLANAIAKYMGKSRGELKELAKDGLITSDVIKGAMFAAAKDINKQYEEMPRTFADVSTSIKNTAQKEFQGVADKISEMLNNEKVIAFMDRVEDAIKVVARGAEWMVDMIGRAASWVYDHMDYILVIMSAIALYIGVTMIPAILSLVKAIFLKAVAWAAAHWQLLALMGIMVVAYAIFEKTGSILTTLAWVILMVVGVFLIWVAVQWALNGALYACPIVWIIVIVLAIIAAIFLLIKWILKLVNSTNSALGIIMGALFTAAAFIYNLFAALVNSVVDSFAVVWNFIAAFANFFANVFDDPVGAVARLFFDLVDTVLGLLEGLASAIDTIFGSNLSSAVSGWRNNLGSWVDKTYGKGKEVMAKFDQNKYHLGRWEYGDAWDSGLKFGNNLSDKIESFNPKSALSDLLGGGDDNKYKGYDYDKLAKGLKDPSGNVPVDVKKNSDKEVDISDEDLKMLKDIATREYMLNYKHITPNVNIKFGDVRETADVNKVKKAISKMMEEELAELYLVEEA